MVKLDYLLSKGFSVFPCSKNGKKPVTENGYKSASRDIETINTWFKNNDNNVGVPTGKLNGITVLDVDKKYGGFYSLEKFNVPKTPYVETGGGGRHYYFKYTPKAQTGANRIGPGLDIRNDGAYVIAPPSIHASGKEYVWCDEDMPFAEAPEWLESSDFAKETHKFVLPEGVIPSGHQDDILFRYACSLRQKHNTPGMIYEKIKKIISDPLKCPQEKNNPFTDKDIERWIKGACKHELRDDWLKKKAEAVIFLNPIDCLSFKKLEIPPVEFWCDGIVQKKGRTMISAQNNKGKTFFTLNLLASICSGQEKFLDHFDNDTGKPNALYFDFEMGESALQERLALMGKVTDLPNLYVQSLYGWDMLDETYQTAMEDIIQINNIQIIAFDPLGSMWHGDENKRETVKQLTDYLDYVMDKYKTSIIITHHWRKASKDFKEGGEMAAGSYGWGKWLDNHLTLQGEINSLIISSQKNRNQKKWDQVRASLDEDTLLFKYMGEFKNTKKFTDDDLLGLFNSFGVPEVTRPELLKKGALVCSKTTLHRLIDESKYLKVDKSKKPHTITKNEAQVEFLEQPEETGWDE